jgi:uncharacterized protein YkwD
MNERTAAPARIPARRTLLVLALSAAVASVPLVADTAQAAARPKEKKLASMINRTRFTRGVKRIALNAELSRIARAHSRKMARHETLYHSNLKRMANNGDYVALAENVGMAYSVKQMHRLFMKSDGHRKNMMKPYWTDMGVGIFVDGPELWVTELFKA